MMSEARQAIKRFLLRSLDRWENGQYRISVDLSRIIVFSTILTAVLTIIAAILSIATAGFANGGLAVFLVIWLIAAIVTLYGTYRYLRNQLDLHSVRRIRTFLADGDAKHHRLLAQQTAVDFSILTLRGLLARSQYDELDKDLHKLLTPLISLRTSALGFRDDAIYNLVVYVYNSKNDIMELKWRECDKEGFKRLKYEPMNRNWHPGHGHPGISYYHEEPWIVPIATKANYPGLFPESSRERDERLYASFMSIPIGNYLPDSRAVATLTITSSRANQFNYDNFGTVCNIYRSILSTYFQWRGSLEVNPPIHHDT